MIHTTGINYDQRASGVTLGYFSDQTGAERAVNALRHAVELCANAQPF